METADQLKERGIKLYNQRDYEAAGRVFQQALDAYQTENRRDMVAEMQTNIGLIHRALGEHQQALDVMQAALRAFQELKDQLRAAQVLGNLGGVYTELNDHEQAHNCYRQAADVFNELGEKKMYGDTLLAIARLQVKEGKWMAGASTYEVGLEQFDKLTATQKIMRNLIGIRKRLTGA